MEDIKNSFSSQQLDDVIFGIIKTAMAAQTSILNSLSVEKHCFVGFSKQTSFYVCYETGSTVVANTG